MKKTIQNRFGFDPIELMPVGRKPRRRFKAPAQASTQNERSRETVTEPKPSVPDGIEDLQLQRIPVTDILTTGLPRDRLDLDGVARSCEMAELKASIRAYGQKEPIELYVDKTGALQLKKGWRRLTALRALRVETGEERFFTALARVDRVTGRLRHYIDMIEENVLREDLTFAELAQVAIAAAEDRTLDGQDPFEMVGRLYASVHKTKRSYIRAFVTLLTSLGEDLRFPKCIPRDLGIAAARLLKAESEQVVPLRHSLRVCYDPKAQINVLRTFVRQSPPRKEALPTREITVGSMTVTVRKNELRIRDRRDFTKAPHERLELAIAAFLTALGQEAAVTGR